MCIAVPRSVHSLATSDAVSSTQALQNLTIELGKTNFFATSAQTLVAGESSWRIGIDIRWGGTTPETTDSFVIERSVVDPPVYRRDSTYTISTDGQTSIVSDTFEGALMALKGNLRHRGAFLYGGDAPGGAHDLAGQLFRDPRPDIVLFEKSRWFAAAITRRYLETDIPRSGLEAMQYEWEEDKQNVEDAVAMLEIAAATQGPVFLGENLGPRYNHGPTHPGVFLAEMEQILIAPRAHIYDAGRLVARELIDLGNAYIGVERTKQIFVDVFRPPLLPVVPFDETWRTDAVVTLARNIFIDGDFALLPILGDSLSDAGCTDEGLIAQCKAPVVRTRGSWIRALLLDNNKPHPASVI